uniref:Serine and arginine rich splicing factor 6 n=1 Tax=Labrus bergylta TaxID=56723 RepID=A0A3Q3EPZ6_9LABR
MPRVYIGRLSYHVREKDIQRFFSGYGKLMEIDLKNGYGFVEFEDNRDADDAVYELNGKDLCGERVIVEHARGPRRDRDGHSGGYGGGGRSNGYSSRTRAGRDKYGPPVRTEYRLIVENLSSRCSWQDLKDFMRQAGEVTYADAHKERTNEGVIEFRSQSDMKRAIDKLDGTDINGRKIRLVPDRTRKRRSYSGSRSRSRSHRRSRSRSRRSSRSRSRSNSSKSRSRNRRSRSNSRKSKSRSRSHKSHSRSAERKSRSAEQKSRSADRKSRSAERKSRSKSRSKVKSERDSRSRSKEISGDKKSCSRSPSPLENGKEERATKSASRSPSPQEDDRQSKSRERRSASRSRSRSRSRSASQD